MRIIYLIALVLMNVVTTFAQPGQSEFQPVTEIPASEQLPSAPLVIAAYAFVWLAFMFYVWTMWRKLGKVEQELQTLATQIARPRAARGEGVPPFERPQGAPNSGRGAHASGPSGARGPRE